MMFTVVVKYYNQFSELIDSEIVDSTTRSGATRKAKGRLKDTFFIPIRKITIENYQYWDCYDIADLRWEKGEVSHATIRGVPICDKSKKNDTTPLFDVVIGCNVNACKRCLEIQSGNL